MQVSPSNLRLLLQRQSILLAPTPPRMLQQGDCSICIVTRDSPMQLMQPSLILASYTIFSDLFVFLRHPRICSERPIKSIRVRVRGTSPEGVFSWVPGGKNATEEESENVAESLEVKVYLPISNLHRLGW